MARTTFALVAGILLALAPASPATSGQDIPKGPCAYFDRCDVDTTNVVVQT